MIRHLLIAESGGSKTDWVFCSSDKTEVQFETASLHPSMWDSFDWEQLLRIWSEYGIFPEQTELHFYGAGCNKQDTSLPLLKQFSEMGIASVHVAGDLLAACRASCESGSGTTAILGSGSVLIVYREGKIVKHHGGLGRKVGDEGAGYYFGKLIIQAYREHRLVPAVMKKLSIRLFSQYSADVLEQMDQEILEIARKLSDIKSDFQSVHTENIQLFFDKHVNSNIERGEIIHFVGSYAYYYQDYLKVVCRSNGYIPGEIIARPIEKLIMYYKKRGITNA